MLEIDTENPQILRVIPDWMLEEYWENEDYEEAKLSESFKGQWMETCGCTKFQAVKK